MGCCSKNDSDEIFPAGSNVSGSRGQGHHLDEKAPCCCCCACCPGINKN